MKCPNCLNNLNAKLAYCPYCRKRLPNLPTSTISEAKIFQLDDTQQPRALRGIVQFCLLIICVIALGFVINFITTEAPVAETVAAKITLIEKFPEAAANNAETVEVEPISAEAPAPVEPKILTASQPKTISILSDTIVAKAIGNSVRPVTPSTPMLVAAKPVAVQNAPELSPRRKPQVTEYKPVRREIPPAPELTKVNSSNSELRLEIDSSAVVLQKNIGLVSINSYVPARIYIDGQFSGITPRAVKLVAGNHHISLMADGYREYTRHVKVDGHQQIGMVASMTRKNTTQVAGIVEQ